MKVAEQSAVLDKALAVKSKGEPRRVFGAANIKRVLQRQKRDFAADAETSIANKPHANNREAERRRRQEARRGKD